MYNKKKSHFSPDKTKTIVESLKDKITYQSPFRVGMTGNMQPNYNFDTRRLKCFVLEHSAFKKNICDASYETSCEALNDWALDIVIVNGERI